MHRNQTYYCFTYFQAYLIEETIPEERLKAPAAEGEPWFDFTVAGMVSEKNLANA